MHHDKTLVDVQNCFKLLSIFLLEQPTRLVARPLKRRESETSQQAHP